jgi:general secretion pathway protein A
MQTNNKKLLSLFGLKWNPFRPEVPTEALYRSAEIGNLIWKTENLVMDGGIACITGESGYGKSVALRLVNAQLNGLRDVTVARMDRPQSGLADFYREMGELFGVELKVSNRYGGFQALRKKWQSHIDTTLLRPVLLIDESQQMQTVTLSELRLLLSDQFDSRKILSVVLAGDLRLMERLKDPDLLPLRRRLRPCFTLTTQSDGELKKMLEHALTAAGTPKLMTAELIDTVIAHSAGNPSTMMNTCDDLLSQAIVTDGSKLDEKLFLELYEKQLTKPTRARR